MEILKATRRNFYTLLVLTKKFFPYTGFNVTELTKRLTNPHITYLVARENGATVGFADFEIQQNSCKLMGLAVLEEHRGKGIAKRLLTAVIGAAKQAKCTRLYLLVAERNEVAKKLYSSMGFELKGKTDKVLDGKEIYIMEKKL